MLPWSLAAAAATSPAAAYDQLYISKDYAGLASRLGAAMHDPGMAVATLDWERAKATEGAGLFIAGQYALDLLAVADPGRPGAAAAARNAAVITAFYAVALIEIDGGRCADPESASARQRQFLQILAPVWRVLEHEPDGQVPDDLARALLEERRTAPLRPPDDYLCRGFTSDIPDALAENAHPVDPRFVADDLWRQRAATAREKLPAALTSLAIKLRTPSAAPSPKR